METLVSIPEPPDPLIDCPDLDGDGIRSSLCGGSDCDDHDAAVGASAARSCYSGPEGTGGVGACTEGAQSCSDGVWTQCAGEVHPSVETCDGIDNDCNSAIDEVPPRTCYTGDRETLDVGACSSGMQACTNGAWGTCDGELLPTAEVCDDVDNDCDGQVDEEVTRYCHNGPPGTGGVGACAMGVQTCSAGSWGRCDGDVLPSAEICDGYDNDCDGSTDEALVRSCYDGPDGTAGDGICTAGVQTCTGAVWSACVGQVMPGVESCDGLDNDCDGKVDDGLVVSCYDGPADRIGVGVCAGGTSTCVAGTWGSCAGQVLPGAEVCDNLDNDCNGSVDEALTKSCYTGPKGTRRVGVCEAGEQTCTAGAWSACEGEITPTPESCDDLDNDCDGSTDEALVQACYSGPEGTVGIGQCAAGSQSCSAGAWSGCQDEKLPSVETCDNLDNDCDGQRDEALSRACYSGPAGTEGVGVCIAGTETCSAGHWSACGGAVTPNDELCDAADNDCDGSTDEKIVRVSQAGADQPILTTPLPADIIVLMDTSCSMNEEIAALERNLDVNLAQVLGQSQLDYRVIMIARFGTETHAVCIESPLSGLRNCIKAPACPVFGPRFFHYNGPIESHDSLYRVITTYADADNCGLAPAGWSVWLRPDAIKHFIELTDDDPSGGDPAKLNSMNAESFDQNLLALSNEQFGTPSARKYVWHTIGGLKENTPVDAPWLPEDPLVEELCTGNGGNVKGYGVEYQKLSTMTGGYRFPLCQYDSFDSIFQAIAAKVVSRSEMSCTFEVASTAVPPDSSMSNATLELIPTNGGAVQPIAQVRDAEACSGMSFYASGNRIYLCPAACTAWQADPTALVDVLFTCSNQVSAQP